MALTPHRGAPKQRSKGVRVENCSETVCKEATPLDARRWTALLALWRAAHAYAGRAGSRTTSIRPGLLRALPRDDPRQPARGVVDGRSGRANSASRLLRVLPPLEHSERTGAAIDLYGSVSMTWGSEQDNSGMRSADSRLGSGLVTRYGARSA
jgi:hypothetical protein